jgi:hypothetical protein
MIRYLFTRGYLDHPRHWIDTEPARVVRPELKDSVAAVKARRDLPDGVSEDPLGKQRALRRTYGVGCRSNVESVCASSTTQKSERALRPNQEAEARSPAFVTAWNRLYH